MSNTTFRQCALADLETVAHFVDQLYTTDPGEVPANPDVKLTFAEFERHPEKGNIIVFEQEGKLVGYALLVFFWSNEFRGDIIEIDEMVVDEKYRGSGIGKAFFRWMDSTFCGCRGFALQTSPKNEMARRLYESVGFVASKNRYFIKLRTCLAR